MRVTKTIREFIEAQVDIKANQSENIAELKRKADEVTQKFQEDREKASKECVAIYKAIMDKYGIDHNGFDRMPCHYCSEYRLPENIAYTKAVNELSDKKRTATLNIIAEMELGGTKAELMEKLNALSF